jgi:hypothetical protein
MFCSVTLIKIEKGFAMIGFKRKLMVDSLTASLGFTGASQSALFDRGGNLCRIQDHQVSGRCQPI